MYLVFPRMPGESYRGPLRSLLLCLCDVFRSLINSPVCWFATRLHKSAPFISHHSTGKPGWGGVGGCGGWGVWGGGGVGGSLSRDPAREFLCLARLNFRRRCKMDLIRPCGFCFQSINCYHALAALGDAFGDPYLKHAGQLHLAMEIASVREYWQVWYIFCFFFCFLSMRLHMIIPKQLTVCSQKALNVKYMLYSTF